MPCLKYMIANANTTELRMLRGKTIECVSLIGLAVGAEKFTADASEVLKGEFSNFHQGSIGRIHSCLTPSNDKKMRDKEDHFIMLKATISSFDGFT